jgi:hypothetical protein
MKILVTEEQIENLMSKYEGNVDNKILTYMKRHFPITTKKLEGFPRTFRFITIDDYGRNLDDSKKMLVNRMFNILEDEFPDVDKNIIRRTIKYYIDISRSID